MCLAQGLQRSDTGGARTHSYSVSSQALYHWPLRSHYFQVILNKILHSCSCFIEFIKQVEEKR